MQGGGGIVLCRDPFQQSVLPCIPLSLTSTFGVYNLRLKLMAAGGSDPALEPVPAQNFVFVFHPSRGPLRFVSRLLLQGCRFE